MRLLRFVFAFSVLISSSAESSPAVAKARVSVPNIGIVQPPSTATASINQTFTSAPLVADGDNATTLNTFFNQLPAGVSVTLPPGVWPVNTGLFISKRMELSSVSGATIRLIASGSNADVLKVGDWLEDFIIASTPMAGRCWSRIAYSGDARTKAS
jgi:hypothetical protein